jgi:hypothetical protein
MRGVCTLLALLFATAGCSIGSDGGAAIPERTLSVLVLQPEDMGRGYIRFDEGRQGIADRPERSDPERFGRKDGWKARYRRPPAAGTKGPLVVESRVDLFDNAGGASDEFDSARDEAEQLARRLGGDVLDPPRLGDEAFAVTSAAGGGSVRDFTVLWREENATALLRANGLEGRVVFAQVLRLARKQQARLARAAR